MDSPAKKLDFHETLNFNSVLNLIFCTQRRTIYDDGRPKAGRVVMTTLSPCSLGHYGVMLNASEANQSVNSTTNFN